MTTSVDVITIVHDDYVESFENFQPHTYQLGEKQNVDIMDIIEQNNNIKSPSEDVITIVDDDFEQPWKDSERNIYQSQRTQDIDNR